MKKKIYQKRRPLIIPEAYIIEEEAKRKPKKTYFEWIYLPTSIKDSDFQKEPINKEDKQDEGFVTIIKL